MRIAANVCGAVSVFISSLYWACIALPQSYWPAACPWGHSEAAFFRTMFVGIILSLVAVWKGSRWWIIAVVLVCVSLFMGGSTV